MKFKQTLLPYLMMHIGTHVLERQSKGNSLFVWEKTPQAGIYQV